MKLCALALALAAGVGCSQTFLVESDPAGADVWIGGKYKGTTPGAFKVGEPKGYSGSLEVIAKKEGYLPANQTTSWSNTWHLTREWNQTRYFLKLHKLEDPAPANKASNP